MEKHNKKIKKLVDIVIEAGGEIAVNDYGLSVRAIFPEQEEAFWLSLAFRAERDGYDGYKIMNKEYLKEHLEFMKSNRETTSDRTSGE